MVAKGYPFSNQIYVSNADRSAVAVQEAAFAEKRDRDDKNFEEKALIPLPPTGSASVFFAKRASVQITLPAKLRTGAGNRLAIAQCAKLCKEMKYLHTARISAQRSRDAFPPRFHWAKPRKRLFWEIFSSRGRSF